MSDYDIILQYDLNLKFDLGARVKILCHRIGKLT